MQKLVDGEVTEFQPDVVFVDGWLMAQYLPAGFTGLKLLHEHNAEYQLWERQAAAETVLRKPVATREAARVRRYEASVLPSFDVVFAVSQEDRRALQEIGGDPNRIRVIPNIPDEELMAKPSPSFEATEPVVLYFGTLSWQPNIEGLDRYLTFGHKQIIKRVPEARLVVAGKGASPELARRVSEVPNTEFAGEVDDPESLYRRARVVVDASRTGGGTRLKVLNALARGVPVVASAEAARGLDIVAGEHVIVARNEHMLVDAVVSLLQDPARWRVLSENGRALIRARYMPDVAFRALDEVLAHVPRRN
jgi:glycosyltransferase involved in cell wall biosynthesis